ncbi:hypothetical protein Syn6312_2022 [Synechococcus sp. PCC 6312]|nr:hypothetical protein Syn6312_2022 [Synechococcus sp. PCC 6312]
MKIKVVIWQEDGVWCGSVPALPGCHTWGESYEELLEMLKEAIIGWLEVASEDSNMEVDSEKQLVELSLSSRFQERLFAGLLNVMVGFYGGLWAAITSILEKILRFALSFLCMVIETCPLALSKA